MSPIDIDPATGAVIVTPASDTPAPVSTTGSGNADVAKTNEFVASVTGESKPVEKPADAIPLVKTDLKPVAMDNKIEEAKQFNANLKLANEGSVTTPVVVEELGVDKDTALRDILKRNGMDSQQQSRAFSEIKALFQ